MTQLAIPTWVGVLSLLVVVLYLLCAAIGVGVLLASKRREQAEQSAFRKEFPPC